MSRSAQASGERGGQAMGMVGPPGSGGGRTPTGMPPGHLPGPPQSMHHPDFHHPSPQHHMAMGGMHASPTKMHPGAHPGHHGPAFGHWGGPGDMGQMGRGDMQMEGMHHYQQQQFHGMPYGPQMGHGHQQQHGRLPPGGGPPGGPPGAGGGTDDVEVMSTDSSSSSSTDSN